MLIDWTPETVEALGALYDAGVRAVFSEGVSLTDEAGFPAPSLDGLHSVGELMVWAYAQGLLGVGRGVGVKVNFDSERRV